MRLELDLCCARCRLLEAWPSANVQAAREHAWRLHGRLRSVGKEREEKTMKRILLSAIGLVALGCAHHPAPTDQVAKSIAAVRGAEEAGAARVPEAALHLKLAQEEIERAKQLMADDQNQAAEDKAERASQDAELALVLARLSASERDLSSFAGNAPSAGGEAPVIVPPSGGTR